MTESETRKDAGAIVSESAVNPTLPPLRRAPSVFGTRGSEIVVRPAPQAIAREQLIDTLREPAIESLGVQENTNEISAQAKRRRIRVHFRELPPEHAAAYVRPLFVLFNEYAGDDEIALLFDRSDGPIKIGAPHGVAYDAIADAVAEMIGDDAVVEIL